MNYAAVKKGMGVAEVAALGPALAPRHEYYYKPLEAGGKRTAVLLMHTNPNPNPNPNPLTQTLTP